MLTKIHLHIGTARNHKYAKSRVGHCKHVATGISKLAQYFAHALVRVWTRALSRAEGAVEGDPLRGAQGGGD